MTHPPLLRQPPRHGGLSLKNFNISNLWGFRLAQAIRAVHVGVFELMIMMETNITNQDY